jgi:hypothetical protein
VKHILITPAHNEERFITKTLDPVVAQTQLPEDCVEERELQQTFRTGKSIITWVVLLSGSYFE